MPRPTAPSLFAPKGTCSAFCLSDTRLWRLARALNRTLRWRVAMSSLCHRPHRSIHSRCWLTLATGALLIADPVLAAEVYVQPLASVEAQTSSNVQLDTDSTQVEQVDGYFADAAMVIGVATPE